MLGTSSSFLSVPGASAVACGAEPAKHRRGEEQQTKEEKSFEGREKRRSREFLEEPKALRSSLFSLRCCFRCFLVFLVLGVSRIEGVGCLSALQCFAACGRSFRKSEALPPGLASGAYTISPARGREGN